MKKTRIHSCILLATLFIECSVWATSEGLVPRVWNALADVATAMPDGRRKTPEYLYARWRGSDPCDTVWVIRSVEVMA